MSNAPTLLPQDAIQPFLNIIQRHKVYPHVPLGVHNLWWIPDRYACTGGCEFDTFCVIFVKWISTIRNPKSDEECKLQLWLGTFATARAKSFCENPDFLPFFFHSGHYRFPTRRNTRYNQNSPVFSLKTSNDLLAVYFTNIPPTKGKKSIFKKLTFLFLIVLTDRGPVS